MHSLPVKPVAPNTATDMLGGARGLICSGGEEENFIIMAAKLFSARAWRSWRPVRHRNAGSEEPTVRGTVTAAFKHS